MDELAPISQVQLVLGSKTMFYWIYDIPTYQLMLWFAGIFIGFTWIGSIFIRPFLRLFVKSQPGLNDIVGYMLSCFCVFYGLLLGLVAMAAYQNYGTVELTVAKEASSLAGLYRDISAFPEAKRIQLQQKLRDYTTYLVKKAWPLQRIGMVPTDGVTMMDDFQKSLLELEPEKRLHEIILAEAFHQYNNYIDFRRMRLYYVTSGIPKVLWYVVVLGAVINIVLIWLLDTTLMSQLLIGGLVTLFIGTVLGLIAAMDYPFRGNVCISSEAFQILLDTLMLPQQKS